MSNFKFLLPLIKTFYIGAIIKSKGMTLIISPQLGRNVLKDKAKIHFHNGTGLRIIMHFSPIVIIPEILFLLLYVIMMCGCSQLSSAQRRRIEINGLSQSCLSFHRITEL